MNYHNVMLNAPSWHDFCTDSEKGYSYGIKCVIRWCSTLRIGSEVYLWTMSTACWVAAYVVEPFQTAVCFFSKIFFSLEWILLSWYSIIICCRDQTSWIERKHWVNGNLHQSIVDYGWNLIYKTSDSRLWCKRFLVYQYTTAHFSLNKSKAYTALSYSIISCKNIN